MVGLHSGCYEFLTSENSSTINLLFITPSHLTVALIFRCFQVALYSLNSHASRGQRSSATCLAATAGRSFCTYSTAHAPLWRTRLPSARDVAAESRITASRWASPSPLPGFKRTRLFGGHWSTLYQRGSLSCNLFCDYKYTSTSTSKWYSLG